MICVNDINLKIMKIKKMQDYCYRNNSENVTLSMRLSKGSQKLKGMRVNVISNNFNETIDYEREISSFGFQINLEGLSVNFINKKNLIEYVELIPYIDNRGIDYYCTESNLVIKNISYRHN